MQPETWILKRPVPDRLFFRLDGAIATLLIVSRVEYSVFEIFLEPFDVGECSLTIAGAIVNRTYVTHKILHISLFLRTIFGPFNYGRP